MSFDSAINDKNDTVKKMPKKYGKPFCWQAKRDEFAEQLGINNHHGGGILETTAIVWRREYGDQTTAGEEFIAVLHDLHKDIICGKQLE